MHAKEFAQIFVTKKKKKYILSLQKKMFRV